MRSSGTNTFRQQRFDPCWCCVHSYRSTHLYKYASGAQVRPPVRSVAEQLFAVLQHHKGGVLVLCSSDGNLAFSCNYGDRFVVCDLLQTLRDDTNLDPSPVYSVRLTSFHPFQSANARPAVFRCSRLLICYHIHLLRRFVWHGQVWHWCLVCRHPPPRHDGQMSVHSDTSILLY